MDRLAAEIAAATVVIEVPDIAAIRATWRDVVDNLGSLSERATLIEMQAARNALRGILGIMRVDRRGKGHADLTIGACLQGMVAGA